MQFGSPIARSDLIVAVFVNCGPLYAKKMIFSHFLEHFAIWHLYGTFRYLADHAE